jgi:hypothetical protein
MTFDIRQYILEQNDSRQTLLSEGKMSKSEGRAMLKKLMASAAKKGMSEKEFWDYMDPKEWEDMGFPIREAINEAAFSSDDARAISSVRSAGGAKAVLSKAGPGALSNYSWSPKSGDGFAVMLAKDNRFYRVTLMPIEDGDPTGQIHQEYKGTDFKVVMSAVKRFLKRVK